ncbi:hypothetical protein FKM82_007948 [Ascaphus truei]
MENSLKSPAVGSSGIQWMHSWLQNVNFMFESKGFTSCNNLLPDLRNHHAKFGYDILRSVQMQSEQTSRRSSELRDQRRR